MTDILKEPFSNIVRWENTEVVTVTTEPDWEDDIIEKGLDFINRFKPTDLDYEHGLAIKETPDGKLSQHVVIWHAKWSHEDKTKRPPLLDIPSRQ
ncbi:MAG: hypothetical protein A3B38_04280 [Candidatus Levybacteria bacterium RIFCSPLOWO2_01_FULL_36_13]|nr:MAG: hypothetical protein A2684_01205 [Candidatus Levybacteria bacterium RIFCSPHIGHO2_01_FULL_36_15b]OGH34344.1 MAG: hypothetical protein A3B38_04280 [Candidatus Levybacteria bacterium RIFCSPLOWO2_01_FULL_36_13]